MAWRLEEALCDIAGVRPLERALLHLGLLEEGAELLDLEVVEDWRRGGSETYVLVFLVHTSIGSSKLILKAYVAPPGTGDLSAGVEELMRRRGLLSARGIATPHLYGVHRADWLEEYVAEDIATALKDGARRIELATDLLLIAVALDRLGFAPLAPFSDLRARGNRTVMIDFGQDLGPPDVSLENQACQAEAVAWLLEKYPDIPVDGCLARAQEAFVRSLMS